MHGHDHHHHHHHHTLPPSPGRPFRVGIALNLAFVAVEGVIGWQNGSLALLTDAGHNLSDVGSLALALAAFQLAKKAPSSGFSYGYRKSTVLASLANALLLVLAMGALGFEALQRLQDPPAVPGLTVALVAGIGVIVNSISAWLFHKDQAHDLNARGAYLHLAADAAVSLGVLISGVVIFYTGWLWLDPAVSFVVLVVVLWSTWGLLRESLRLALDAVPQAIEPGKVREAALKISGVRDIHHIHVWAISTTENALTAHLVLEEGLAGPEVHQIKNHFRHALEHLDIQHATLETETVADDCRHNDCC